MKTSFVVVGLMLMLALLGSAVGRTSNHDSGVFTFWLVTGVVTTAMLLSLVDAALGANHRALPRQLYLLLPGSYLVAAIATALLRLA